MFQWGNFNTNMDRTTNTIQIFKRIKNLFPTELNIFPINNFQAKQSIQFHNYYFAGNIGGTGVGSEPALNFVCDLFLLFNKSIVSQKLDFRIKISFL